MKAVDITIVRIYLTEDKARVRDIIELLHDREQVSGVTVFRGISGFGKSGVVHSSSLLDLSLNLPLVVEFFDKPDKVQQIIDDLGTIIEPGHIVSWPAIVHE